MENGYVALKTERGKWEGIKKTFAFPTEFGPALWSRIQKDGVESLETLTQYRCWDNFVDKHHKPHFLAGKRTDTFNHKTPPKKGDRWVWIIDIDNERLEVRHTTDITEITSNGIYKHESGFTKLRRLWKHTWLYGEGYKGTLPGGGKLPQVMKVGRLARLDINGDEPNWELMEKVTDFVKLSDNTISREKGLVVRFKEGYCRECCKCGEIVKAYEDYPKEDDGYHYFHSDCYNYLLDRWNSEKIFYLNKVDSVDKELERKQLGFRWLGESV